MFCLFRKKGMVIHMDNNNNNNNISDTLNNFKQMLSTEQGQNSINALLGSLSGQQGDPSAPDSNPSPELSPDMMMKMTNLLGTLQNRSGPHFDLLFALRPYLSLKKQGRFEMALRMLQLSKIPQIKDILK